MGHMQPWPSLSEIAVDTREGRRTAAQNVTEALARVDALEASTNAFTQLLRHEALAEASRVDADPSLRAGRLAGVPVAVKAELDVGGVVTTFGGWGNATPATRDCEVVRRLRVEGAVVVGTTNMPEFGQFPFTENVRFGQTTNPAAPRRTAGGSSGGSAAAVASGMVPLAIGGDGGGSIRIPSSACGLFGLKATRGRISTDPLPRLWQGLCTSGPLTRTAADSALVHEVIGGNLPGDHDRLDDAPRDLLRATTTDPGPLRIGLALRPHSPGLALDEEVEGVVRRLADELTGLGHRVVELDRGRRVLPNPAPAFLPLMYAGLRDEADLVQYPGRLEKRTRDSVRRARVAVPAPVLAVAHRHAARLRGQVEQVFHEVDLLLTPTLAQLPPLAPVMDLVGATRASLAAAPLVAYTCLFNVTGHPAASWPAGTATDGTPVGAQLVAPFGRDDLVLQLAGQLDRVRKH